MDDDLPRPDDPDLPVDDLDPDHPDWDESQAEEHVVPPPDGS